MNEEKIKKFKSRIRLFFQFCLFIVVGVLFYLAIIPSGKTFYIHDFTGRSEFIGELSPKERVGDRKTIIGDPVYFSLRTSRPFNQASVEIKYRHIKQDDPLYNSWNAPVIEAGILVDNVVWRYDLEPVENKIIDNIALAWDSISENGTVLLQKEKKYNSIDEFLSSLPSLERVAVYNYDLDAPYLLSDYSSTSEESVVDIAFRGPYQFYTYLDGEELDYEFEFYDLNQNKDADEVNIFLYYEDRLIDFRKLEDDGIAVDSEKISDVKSVDFSLDNLPAGVYKIEVKTNDDIVTEKITTKQNKLAFINKLWIFNDDETNLSLFTDSKRVQVVTMNPDSLQKIQAGKTEIELSETYRQFDVEIEDASSTKFREVVMEKDGLILSGDGVFGFSEEGMINPKIVRVDASLNIIGDDINYILAKYEKPKQVGDWRIGQIELDLTRSYREGQRYSFIISIPGLKLDDDIEDGIEIEEIKVELLGTSLWSKTKEIFKNFLKR